MIRSSSAVKLRGFLDGFEMVGGWKGADGNLKMLLDRIYKTQNYIADQNKKNVVTQFFNKSFTLIWQVLLDTITF